MGPEVIDWGTGERYPPRLGLSEHRGIWGIKHHFPHPTWQFRGLLHFLTDASIQSIHFCWWNLWIRKKLHTSTCYGHFKPMSWRLLRASPSPSSPHLCLVKVLYIYIYIITIIKHTIPIAPVSSGNITMNWEEERVICGLLIRFWWFTHNFCRLTGWLSILDGWMFLSQHQLAAELVHSNHSNCHHLFVATSVCRIVYFLNSYSHISFSDCIPCFHCYRLCWRTSL